MNFAEIIGAVAYQDFRGIATPNRTHIPDTTLYDVTIDPFSH